VQQRAPFYRETTSGTYSRWVYSLAQLFADVPLHLITATLFTLTFYWTVGYQNTAAHFFYFWLMTLFTMWLMPSLGQFFAFAAPNLEAAIGFAELLIICMVLLMGFLISQSAMPVGWLWAYWIDWLHYVLQGYCTNELAGQQYLLPLGDLPPLLGPTNHSHNLIAVPHVDSALDFTTLLTALSALLVDLKQLPPHVADLKAVLANSTDRHSLLTCFIENGCVQHTAEGKLDLQGLVNCVIPGRGHMNPKCAATAAQVAVHVGAEVAAIEDCMLEPNTTVGQQGL